jgi:hypothetical protein
MNKRDQKIYRNKNHRQNAPKNDDTEGNFVQFFAQSEYSPNVSETEMSDGINQTNADHDHCDIIWILQAFVINETEIKENTQPDEIKSVKNQINDHISLTALSENQSEIIQVKQASEHL